MPTFLPPLNDILSNMTTLFFLLLGLWGFYRALRKEPLDGGYLGAIVIGWTLWVINFIVDLWGLSVGMRPSRVEVHILYAIFALVFLPFAYVVLLRGDDSNRGQWVMAFVTLFVWGVAIRSIQTGV